MRLVQFLLFPFSLIYGLVTALRNYLYDVGYKKSISFDVPVISVGNLTVGGTGKTPMVEYLIRLLKDEYNLATLSRGYGRKTRGFRLARASDNAQTLGDEPFQFYMKFSPEVTVAVAEDRSVGISLVLAEEGSKVILMDDAFQHRSVQADWSILLCDYNRPFYKDILLPAGRLRESRLGAKRANVIVVTKCPPDIDPCTRKVIEAMIRQYAGESAPVYFTTFKYGFPAGEPPFIEQSKNPVVAFSGLAQNGVFQNHVAQNFDMKEFLSFPDHHAYSHQDIQKIEKALKSYRLACLLTTEKDMARLIHNPIIKYWPLYVIPIEVEFIVGEKLFQTLVRKAVKRQN